MIKHKNTFNAQRKFAVGAVVPAQPERRIEPAPAALPLSEPRDVRHCGTSATQLLDSVMMMSVHTHALSQPVVVLERLIENDNELNIRIENVRSLKTPPKLPKRVRTIKKKDSPSKQASCRSLRSQMNTNEKRKRHRSESSVTDIEDNRPLKFLRKSNRCVTKKKTFTEAHPKSTSTKLKRVSLRQKQLRYNKMSKNNDVTHERRVEKTMVSTNTKLRKKGSRVPTEEQASASGIRARTVPYTRARHDINIATPSSCDPAAAKRSPNKVKTPKPPQIRTPRPRRQAQLNIVGEKTRAKHSSLLGSVLAIRDTERRSDELERVVGGLVDRTRRSPLVRLHDFSHPKRPTVLSRINKMDNIKPQPNELNVTVEIKQLSEELSDIDDIDQQPIEEVNYINYTKQQPNELTDLGDTEHQPNELSDIGDIEQQPNKLYYIGDNELYDTSEQQLNELYDTGDIEQQPNELYNAGDTKQQFNDLKNSLQHEDHAAATTDDHKDATIAYQAVAVPDNHAIAATDDHKDATTAYQAVAVPDNHAIAVTDGHAAAITENHAVAVPDSHATAATDNHVAAVPDNHAAAATDNLPVSMPNNHAVATTDCHAAAATDGHAAAATDNHAVAVSDDHAVAATDGRATAATDNNAVAVSDDHAVAATDGHAAAATDNHAVAVSDDHAVTVTDGHAAAATDNNAVAIPDDHAVAASDVYAFNDDSEVVAGPSSFRATRSRSASRNLLFPPPPPFPLEELQNGENSEKISLMLDYHVEALTSYAQSSCFNSVNKKLADLLTRCKLKSGIDDTETVVIEDDDDENDGSDSPRPTTPVETVDKEGDNYEIPEAPVFYPTLEEMKDLNSYIEKKIEFAAGKCGIFKIVPPRDFQPPCQLKNVQFKSTNQYICSMYSRWGPASSEMAAIKAHLATQNVTFTRPPLYEGVEVDLVKLYDLVQEEGGLIRVMEERKWTAIAEKMQLNARAGRVKAPVKLDKIYMKHLLPYETLSESERSEVRARISAAWRTRYKKMCARAARPLHRQRRMLGESESSNDEEEPETKELKNAFTEAEDCVVSGPLMNLARFRRVGERVREMRFPGASSDSPPHWAAVERAYWRLVRCGVEHVCVHGAALDTSQDDLGFPAATDEPYGNHPWNLKRLGESNTNVLSALGPTLSATVPTLHLGMMFSTNCWHCDPHHLPWTEYMHQGAPKIWYGIPDQERDAFRRAAEKLCPTNVQRKGLWLTSDTAMIPPRKLMAHGVRLVRTLQAPGEYVVVLPRAFSCSISTGFTVSESVYFASDTWLDGVDKVFNALCADAEPSMFPLEALLEGIVKSPSTKLPRLLRARALLRPMLQAEMNRRREAIALGMRALSTREVLRENSRISRSSWQVLRNECHVCRKTLHWSKMIEISGRVSVCLEHGLRMARAGNGNATTNAGATANAGATSNAGDMAIASTSANADAMAIASTSANADAMAIASTSASAGVTSNTGGMAIAGTSANVGTMAIAGTSSNADAMAIAGTSANAGATSSAGATAIAGTSANAGATVKTGAKAKTGARTKAGAAAKTGKVEAKSFKVILFYSDQEISQLFTDLEKPLR